MSFSKGRFKFPPAQIGKAPARQPVPPVPEVSKADVIRRHVLTVKSSGEIFWHDWSEHERARTNLAIEKAVATENLWKRK
jgi:hypothetical protein